MALNIAVPLSGVGGLSPISPIGIDCWENIKILVSPIGSESSGISSLDSEEAKHQLQPSPPKTPEEIKIYYNGRDILDLGANLETNSKKWNLRYTYLPENNNMPMFLANRSQYHRLGPNGHIPDYSLNKCEDCDYQYPMNTTRSYFCQTSVNISSTTNTAMTYTGIPSHHHHSNSNNIQNQNLNNINAISNSFMKKGILAKTKTTNTTIPTISSSTISTFPNNNVNNMNTNINQRSSSINYQNSAGGNNNTNSIVKYQQQQQQQQQYQQQPPQNNNTTKSIPNGFNNFYSFLNSFNNTNNTNNITNNSNNNNIMTNNINTNCNNTTNNNNNGNNGSNIVGNNNMSNAHQNFVRMYKYF